MKKTLTILATVAAITATGLIPAYAATRSKSSTKAKTSAVAKEKAPSDAASKKSAQEGEPMPSAAASKMATELTTTQKSKLLAFLNDSPAKELVSIDGVAKVRSLAIVDARPFDKIEEVSVVKGIGKATYAKIVTYGKGLTKRTPAKSAKS